MNYVCFKDDWEVIDVILVVDKIEYAIKEFDEFERREAQKFAQKFADSLKIKFVGDRTDT